MLFRITVKLNSIERSALARLAEDELRSLPDQIRVIVREELLRRGFLEFTRENDLPEMNDGV